MNTMFLNMSLRSARRREESSESSNNCGDERPKLFRRQKVFQFFHNEFYIKVQHLLEEELYEPNQNQKAIGNDQEHQNQKEQFCKYPRK